MKFTSIFALAVLFSACSMYQSEFDCPACTGIGCKSVSEVMDMIVERDQKNDLFVPDENDARLLRERVNK